MLHHLATAAGLQIDWEDAHGRPQRVADEVLVAILSALGLPAESERDMRESLDMLAEREAGDNFRSATIHAPIPLPANCAGPGGLLLEDGTRHGVHVSDAGMLPGIAVPGYHRLWAGGQEFRLAIAPPRCFSLADAVGQRRIWGPAVQIASLRDGRSHGDFGTLADSARAFAAHGADAMAISPVHALFPADPRRYSPYSPSSRLFLNILLADPARVGASAEAAPEDVGAALIDWAHATPRRLHLLRRAYAARGDDIRAQVAHFAGACGPELLRHACHDALHTHFFETSGAAGWRDWPAEFHDPAGDAAVRFACEHADEVDFHVFLQWLADASLAHAQATAKQAGMAIGLIGDLAVGVDPNGSDGWSRGHELLSGLSIGAPPDPLGPDGQKWNLTGFAPQALRENAFASFIAMVRSALTHTGGIRIDHALGLRRLWVIPQGGTAGDGAYLRMPIDDLLRLLALESHRARAVVIGEDLGTIPPGFREVMREKAMHGMRALWFERHGDGFAPPHTWAADAIAMTGTHDVPTVAGWWRGRDIDWTWALGRAARAESEEADRALRATERTLLWQACCEAGAAHGPEPAPDTPDPAVDAALAYVGRTPCALALIPMEDIAGMVEQPNLPGTIDEHPNWRRRMPETTATLLDRPSVRQRLTALAETREASVF